MKHLLPLILLQVVTLSGVSAQKQRFSENQGEAWYGGGLIANQSSISSIYTTLVDGSIFGLTPHEERIVNNIGATFWSRFGAPYSDFFIEGQFSFLSTIKSDGEFDGGHFYLRNERDLEYTILFDYDQVNLGLYPALFLPLPNRYQSVFACYVTAGLTWSILTGTSIDYNSNEPQFDLGIEQALEEGLRYRNDLLFVGGAGIQAKINDNFAIECRYTQGWGLVDIIETQQNPYFWTEQDNRTRVPHQLALTAMILFND